MRSNAGFSYLEVLVAITLIACCLVPAIEALQAGILAVNIGGERREERFAVMAKIEEVLAEPFADLENAALTAGSATVPTSYSDAPGTPMRCLVYLAAYDGDNSDADGNNFTGGDNGLLWLQVEAERSGVKLVTLASNRE